MNTAKKLIDEVARHGGRLVREGEGLSVRAPAPLPRDLQARLRAHKAELLKALPAEKADTAQAPAGERSSTPNMDSNSDRTGRASYTHYGRDYQHPDGRVETGTPKPMPRPTGPWPADLNDMLRRVSVAFEWSQQDVADFRQWARRSPEGLADARVFLQAEVAKLPKPSLSERT